MPIRPLVTIVNCEKTVEVIDRYVVWGGGSGGPKERCIRIGIGTSPTEIGKFLEDNVAAQCNIWGKCGVGRRKKTAEPFIRWACTLAPPGKYG